MNVVYNADCMEIMRQLQEQAFEEYTSQISLFDRRNKT